MIAANGDKSLSIYNLSARECPERTRALFGRLSREHPVHWDRYAGTWLISRRAEAVKACTSSQFQERQISGSKASAGCPMMDAVMRGKDAISRQSLLLGEPGHSAWRPLLRTVLSAARIAAMKPWIGQRTAELVDAAPRDGLDVVADIARPLPFEVMARLFGLPASDLSDIRRWSDAYTGIVTGFAPSDLSREYKSLDEFLNYALIKVHSVRINPGSDGLSTLVTLADKIGQFSDLDIAANLIMLVSAAHQTTTGFIAGAVLESLRPSFGPLPGHPLDGETVDELLARVSPSRFVGRTVVEDISLAGCQLRAGQSVLVLLGAVNWDDLSRRKPGRAGSHVAFGIGRHHCPGARLARLEGQVVLEHLFSASTAPRLHDQEVRWGDNVNLPCPDRVLISVSQ